MSTKFWVGVASKEHVEMVSNWEFANFAMARSAQLNASRKGICNLLLFQGIDGR